jgi:hypothetical protein
MMYYEDSDIINLINLHAVVTQIFDMIFIHDFCLVDITSPGTNFSLKLLKNTLCKNNIDINKLYRTKTTEETSKISFQLCIIHNA